MYLSAMHYRYAIIGTGGIGGFYGGRLQKAGAEVHFLLHSDFDHVVRHGLVIDSRDGDFRLPSVKAYNDPAAMPRCDVAVVCLKTTQNHLLGDILPHVLDRSGIVLLLQNGYGEEEPISRLPGVREIIAGLCFICSAKVGPGHIHHQDYGLIRLARFSPDNRPAGITATMAAIAADFAAAGISIDPDEDHLLARWKKLVWNIPFNGLSVTLNADTAQILSDPASARRVEALMGEVVRAAAGFGRRIADEFVGQMIANTRKMRPYFPSMKLDFDAGRPLELESMYANPLRAAAERGVHLPEITRLYEELRQLVATRKA